MYALNNNIYINIIKYKNINYGFNKLYYNIDNKVLNLITKYLYNYIINNNSFKNKNICIFNNKIINNNKKLYITSSFNFNNLDYNKLKDNLENKENYVYCFKINYNSIEDILDDNFCIKMNKYYCNNLKNIINVY